MTEFNPRMSHVKQSATFAAKEKVNALRAQGKRVVDLTFGEPEVDTPDYVKDAATKAMREGKTKYTPVAGIPELRSALASRMSLERGAHVEKEEIIVTNGGKQAIHECLSVLLRDGEQVAIVAPYWVSYPEMVYLAGGEPLVIRPSPEKGWRLSPQDLEQALSPRTRIVILNCPSNPTGVCYSAQELRDFATILKKSNCFILSDEVYDRITFGGKQFVSFVKAVPELSARTITINSFSKSHSMTGWRVGWACASREIIDAMARHQSQATSCINTPAQYGALAALSDLAFARFLSDRYESRIMAGVKALSAPGTLLSVPAVPEGAYYLFIRANELMQKKGIKSSGELATRILDSTGISVVGGAAFGDDASFRVSVTAEKADFDYALDALTKLSLSL